MAKMLVVDTETTGLDMDLTDLLTASFTILDENFQVLETLNIALKTPVRDSEDRGIYRVDPNAMLINKIDLLAHDQNAEYEDKITNKLNALLKKYSEKFRGFNENQEPVKEIEMLQVLGHNVFFDVARLKKSLPGVKWNKYLSHRLLDTFPIAKFMQDCGLIPSGVKCSLQGLVDHFQVTTTEVAHTADGDVARTIGVYLAMVDLLKTQAMRLGRMSATLQRVPSCENL